MCRGLGIQSLARDLGRDISIRLFTDSSAGKGIVHRKGSGKVRLLETMFLWSQDVVKSRKVEVYKIKGTENLADIGTKYLSTSEAKPLMNRICLKLNERVRV